MLLGVGWEWSVQWRVTSSLCKDASSLNMWLCVTFVSFIIDMPLFSLHTHSSVHYSLQLYGQAKAREGERSLLLGEREKEKANQYESFLVHFEEKVRHAVASGTLLHFSAFLLLFFSSSLLVFPSLLPFDLFCVAFTYTHLNFTLPVNELRNDSCNKLF